MLRHHDRLVALLIACVLILVGPAAMAGKSTGTSGRDSAAEKECRGKGRGHATSEKAPSCEQDPEGESPPDSEDTDDGSGRGKDRRHGTTQAPGQERKEEAPGQERKEEPQGAPASETTPPGDQGPPVHSGPALLTVDVDVDRTIAQVGTLLTYEISIVNRGASEGSLTIHSDVPAEVDFISSTEAVEMTDADSLAWSFPSLEPGTEMTIQWTGRVARLGDLDAVNLVTVGAQRADPAPIETHTYLASVQGVRFQRSGAEPDWGTHTERRVVFRSVGAHGPATAASSNAPPVQLPRTGIPLLELSLIAALLILGGLVLTGRGKKHAAAAMMVVLIAAACTSEAPPPQVAERVETPEEKDQVLGTRIKKNDPKQERRDQGVGTPSTPGIPSTDGGSTVPEATDDADTDSETPGGVDTDNNEEMVRDVLLVTVGNEPPPPEPIGETPGSNSVSLVWDEPSRSITTAASGRLLRSEARIDLSTTVSDAGDGMSIGVNLINVTRDERFLVAGHLVVDVVDGSGSVVRLSSPPINEILEPGDEVSADFLLALPSGEYVIGSAFVPS